MTPTTTITTTSTAAGSASAGPVAEGFSGKRTAEIVGITYRQLDYWARTDLVRPSVVDAAGSGSRRRYSYRDLLELKIIKKLLDAGIGLGTVREVFVYLQENLGEDVVSANLAISNHQVVLVRSNEEIIDLVQKGQGVLNLLALGGVKAEIDAIVDLRPPAEGVVADPESPDGDPVAVHAVADS